MTVLDTLNSLEVDENNYTQLMVLFNNTDVQEEITLPLLIKDSYISDYIKTDIKRLKYTVVTDEEGNKYGVLSSIYKILKSSKDNKKFNIYGEIDKLRMYLDYGKFPQSDLEFNMAVLDKSLDELSDLKQLVENYSSKDMVDFPKNYLRVLEETFVEIEGKKYLLPKVVTEITSKVSTFNRQEFLHIINRQIEVVRETINHVNTYYNGTGYQVFTDGTIQLT